MRYEYQELAVEQPTPEYAPSLTSLLNTLGRDGWQVVGMTETPEPGHRGYTYLRVLLMRETPHVRVIGTTGD